MRVGAQITQPVGGRRLTRDNLLTYIDAYWRAHSPHAADGRQNATAN